jgi:hypothetical protein
MSTHLQELAPHLLGAFMIALACVPLVFVWQDRHRKPAKRLDAPLLATSRTSR